MTDHPDLKLGVIGAGRIGRLHIENLAQRIRGATVTAVADVVREAAERCARDFGIPKIYQSPEELLDDAGVDGVLICSSTDSHAPLIQYAADVGVHVFCEKPIALDLQDIDRSLEAVDRAGVLLQVGFNRRFDPGFAQARKLVREGAIGRVHVVRITSRDPEPPPLAYAKVSGGIFLDMTIHDFDMVRFLVGEEATEVYATGQALVDPQLRSLGDVDTACVTVSFPSGAMAVIDNSRRAVYGYDQRAEVFGEGGTIIVGNPRPHEVRVLDSSGDRASVLQHFFVERYSASYLAEVEAFVHCVRSGAEASVTGKDGKNSVLMGYAATRSLRERRPVRLDEPDLVRAR